MDRLTPIHHLIKEKSKIKDITKKQTQKEWEGNKYTQTNKYVFI